MFVHLVWDEASYSYVLGMYLGDGHVNDVGRSYQLRIWLDALYPSIVSECVVSLYGAFPHLHGVHVRDRPGWRVKAVDAGWKQWPVVFPQYGPGPKHERPIVLASWQRCIVDRHPQQFLRGLIHSDGCRCVNRFRTVLSSGRIAQYAYPRYFFSNLSDDIRGLFGEYCDHLEIRWTQSNPRNISVSHRPSVALLDAFIGPKS